VRRFTFPWLACALVLVNPAVSPAQIRGVVTDATARPLPGVLVELWDHQQRLAGQVTDASGRFYLGISGSGPRAVLARGIGLIPLRRSLLAADSVLTLIMQPRAIQVEAVTVEGQTTQCPRKDDPHARALWQRAASHYSVTLSAFGANAHMLAYGAVVPVESLAVIDTARLRESFMSGAYSPWGFQHRRQQARAFYAFQMSGITPPRFAKWEYPLIESVFAWHFADSTFGEWNRLALASSSAGDTAIAFCSQNGHRPYIRGVLRLGPDSTFSEAEWTFLTPAPHEEAGGQVFFVPVDAAADAQPLVPLAGLFWRKEPAGGVYQEWMEYRRWELCDGATNCRVSVPPR
jgi:hypothetical protein